MHNKNQQLLPVQNSALSLLSKKSWKYQKDWNIIKDIITNGCTYPLKDLPYDETRPHDIKAMAERGNHPSALILENAEALDTNTQKEIDQGWVVPAPISILHKMLDLNLIPLGVII